MTNQELADVFDRIASLLEIKGEIVFKIRAYQRAAESLRGMAEDAADLDERGELDEVPGIGKAILEKIRELNQTGKLEFLTKLEEEIPPSLLELLRIPGLGPKKAAMLWKEANILTLQDLETAAKAGLIRGLPGMGAKSEDSILRGLSDLATREVRMSLSKAWELGQIWLAWVQAQPGVSQAGLGGSLRRWKETIGDLDLVAAADDPAGLMEAFTTHQQVSRILGQGENKSSVELKDSTRIQLWAQPPASFGALWLYATGSKDHNVRLREQFQKRKLSLSERGLTDSSGNLQRSASEEEIYAALEMDWIPPELREDKGEIDAAAAHKLPQLIELDDVRMDLHAHTTWSDGVSTVREMADAALELGYTALALTDHSPYVGITGGMKAEVLAGRAEEIARVRAELKDKLLLLHGAEVDIRADGQLDYPDEVLATLDFVVVSLHTSLRQPRAQVTERLLNAIRNPHVDLIAHASGRLFPDRNGADLDWQEILGAARESGVAMEINANPQRLDLDDVHARRAAEMGIPIAINTDAHAPDQFHLMKYGVAVARRAWIEPQMVINTWTNERFTHWLADRKAKARKNH